MAFPTQTIAKDYIKGLYQKLHRYSRASNKDINLKYICNFVTELTAQFL